MLWYTITPNIFHPNGSVWKKRRKIDDIRVAMYAQAFPAFWVLPPGKTIQFKWVGEAFPPLYARWLFLHHGVPRGRLLDLYAGIGGWSLGYVLAGLAEYIELVEINKEKCKYLELNFRRLQRFTENHVEPWEFNVVCTDTREYEPGERFDVVTGSPPCEDFSRLRALSRMYGVELKGSVPLTYRYIEIVEKTRPVIALYENVYAKPLAQLLKNYGYMVEHQDMSIVIPQRRKRLIAWKIFSHVNNSRGGGPDG